MPGVIIFFLIFTLLPYDSSQKAVNIREDSASIKVREFPEQDIQEFKNDPDFIYNRPVGDSLGWWDRLLYEIQRWLSDLTGDINLNWLYKLILYVICPLILLYVILRLLKIPVLSLFYDPGGSRPASGRGLEDNIHHVNFDAEIKKKIENQHYREAVRYMYLKVLKDLTDQQIIRWFPGKTNHEYFDEINDPDLREQFKELTYYYEYIWYGDFPVDKNTLKKAKELANNLSRSLIFSP